MTPPGGRGTESGKQFEIAMHAALARSGYGLERQKDIGTGPTGGRHRVDTIATRSNGTKFLMSLKWQQVRGTVEEKVPYEVIKLLHSLRENHEAYDKAYIVIGGDGWKPGTLEFFLSKKFRAYIPGSDRVEILTRDEALERANLATL